MTKRSGRRAPGQPAGDIEHLLTERPNPASAGLDTRSALEIATIINREDHKVAPAVAKVLPQVAKAIDAVAVRLRRGGRLIYVGTGTSGRIGALDSAECPPTFSADPRQVQYIIAGGGQALAHATEADEDSARYGRTAMRKKTPRPSDVVIGLAASGRTPFTIAALEYARERGSVTVAITCNPGSVLGRIADIPIEVVVGPEVINGSTRMKAGTAEKLICNMITTGAFTRMGFVYDNLMVNVKLKNEKLLERGVRIVQTVTGADRGTARATLEYAGEVRIALIMLLARVSKTEAQRRLRKTEGNVRKALDGPRS